ncbi:MAG TPA: hypothetical protein VLX92_07925 [Kofleriaceae bacterium]|nr:hypothetical protein [Kofleriaceae bacterium]
MHFSFGHVLVLSAVIAAICLLLDREDRVFPWLAVIASALEALIAFDVIALSSARFRIDLILPGVLAVAGGVCWGRAKQKSSITAATVVAIVGLIQVWLAVAR